MLNRTPENPIQKNFHSHSRINPGEFSFHNLPYEFHLSLYPIAAAPLLTTAYRL